MKQKAFVFYRKKENNKNNNNNIKKKKKKKALNACCVARGLVSTITEPLNCQFVIQMRKFVDLLMQIQLIYVTYVFVHTPQI